MPTFFWLRIRGETTLSLLIMHVSGMISGWRHQEFISRYIPQTLDMVEPQSFSYGQREEKTIHALSNISPCHISANNRLQESVCGTSRQSLLFPRTSFAWAWICIIGGNPGGVNFTSICYWHAYSWGRIQGSHRKWWNAQNEASIYPSFSLCLSFSISVWVSRRLSVWFYNASRKCRLRKTSVQYTCKSASAMGVSLRIYRCTPC